jgi:hypothetical protein
VSLKIDRVIPEGDNVRLMVSLQNNQTQAVAFLYSFLEVRDQDKNLLSSLTESLPQTLPPDGKIYQGTIEVLGIEPDSISSLSVHLASYPDEQVKLQVNGISLP